MHCRSRFSKELPLIMTVIVTATFILTFITKTFHPAFIKKSEFFYNLLNVSLFWYIVRLVGMIFAVMAYFKIGPEAVYAKSTGGTLLFSLLPVLFSVFLFAGLFLPFLLNFGLLELCGALMKNLMRPVFKFAGAVIDRLYGFMARRRHDRRAPDEQTV